jgi:DNA-binding MarR family transcriptional regulator
MSESEKQIQPPLSKVDYESLSEFRYQLRRFMHFSEQAARSGGLTPLQYQLLLHVRGFPGRDWATVGELAERLQIKPHGTVALISRCEDSGLVCRQTGSTDRRQVEIRLSSAGEEILERLAGLHKVELRSLKNTFRVEQIASFNDDDAESE